MTRVFRILVFLYLGLALVGRYREAQGDLVCDCEPECWCKRPGPSLFRWVFPFGHTIRGS
ncbi:MAG: hypothetical protein M3161_05960 [Actinomycetota bacterium]|nr:hypothetical protein [Actinomycetota bacterium]